MYYLIGRKAFRGCRTDVVAIDVLRRLLCVQFFCTRVMDVCTYIQEEGCFFNKGLLGWWEIVFHGATYVGWFAV